MIRKIRSGIAATIMALGAMLFVSSTASATLPEPGFLGENPSGKVTIQGNPLFSHKRPPHSTALRNAPPPPLNSSDSFAAECPPTVRCIVMPAAFSANNGDVGDYGNYDRTNRPYDGMKIDSIVIHDTEGDLQSTLDAFKDPTFYASSHYVIDKDGTIYQMVPTKDIAWHAGNWSINMHSIGIEHVGYAAKSESYTPEMYKASQQLVNYLSNKFGIPKDRAHILGHDNVPARAPDRLVNMHVDPGPYWNWQHYMKSLGAPVLPRFTLLANTITIAPTWPHDKQLVTGCWDDTRPNSCVPDELQPTNFTYLRTQPNQQAPFFTDTALGEGSTSIRNNAARVFHGQSFAVKDKRIDSQGIWYEIWINGKSGWLFSAWTQPTAFTTTTKTVSLKPGLESTPIYGRAVPERAEYPADLLAVPPASTFVPAPTPLPYVIAKGQRYTVTDLTVPTDNFYAWAIDASFPYDHTLFKGKTKYIQIQAGNRVGYVKASDVIVR